MEADIDIEMVPIIKILWERNIKTNACCQDINNSGKSHIAFDVPEAEKFICQFYNKEKSFKAHQTGKVFIEDDSSISPIIELPNGSIYMDYSNRRYMDNFQRNIVEGKEDFEYRLAFIEQHGCFVIHVKFSREVVPEIIRRLNESKNL